MPMEAVLRFASRCISLEASLGCCASLMDVPDLTGLICANKHSIVVLRTLIDQPPVGESIQHLLVDTPAPQKVSVDPPHILVNGRGLQRFLRKRLHWLPDGANSRIDQCQHRLPVIQAIEAADKVHRITANLLILVKPQVAPDGHLLSVIQPHILRAAPFHFLTALPQVSRQIGQSGLFPLLLCKGDVCSHFSSCSCLSSSLPEIISPSQG